MYRCLLVLLLLIPGYTVAAQHATDRPFKRAALRVEQSREHALKQVGYSARRISSDSIFLITNALRQPLAVPAPIAPQCASRSRRIWLGAVLGAIAGGAAGVAYGSAGHPGLPHVGADIPEELEYTPLFIIMGGALGGVIGGHTAKCA